ncbi:copper amine oxidase N-terminal domain-containing protein [Paenibacillus puerhi]|uniref:copper amine oxidase N-terminal domain-containing protein n=1 Tax=Paenibacillus puerhi TaxID=2692622 RepID=UPI0013581DC3|nr:copper amine oxidase N-terminal domain-containing protein [Paenibacillus puerhi]
MIKKWCLVLSACLLGFSYVSISEAAAENNVIPVYLDGNPVPFEVPPILENGTTLVQFRPIFERLGLAVGWDEASRTVSGKRNNLEIELVIDELEASVNKQSFELELAPRLVEGNTFVPLRFVSEASGAEVVWDGENSRIYMRSKPSSTGSGTPEPEEESGPAKTPKSEKGSYTYPSGDKYTGQLANGEPEGTGKLTDAAGKLLFNGVMVKGNPSEGIYKSYYPNGQLETDGRLKDGKLNGAGKQYTESGKLLFSGTFVNGERQAGTLYSENGDKYTGDFSSGVPAGKGKLVYKNGDTYEGSFVEGRREGQGTYTTSKGEKIEGEFLNNLKHGVVRHYDKKGNLLSVSEYVNDVLISKVDLGTGAVPLPDTSTAVPSSGLAAENSRHEKAVQAIKERYNASKKQLDDQIAQLRKTYPGLYSNQTDYEKALNEAILKQTSLQSKLSLLSQDGSKSGEAARAELNKQLEAAQVQLSKVQEKGIGQRQVEFLKEQLAQLKKGYEGELKQENTLHAERVKVLK